MRIAASAWDALERGAAAGSNALIQSLAMLYPHLQPGELLHGTPEHSVFRRFWQNADPDSFHPPADLADLRLTKLR